MGVSDSYRVSDGKGVVVGVDREPTYAVFGRVFRNRSLLRVEGANLAFNCAEWGFWVSIFVWAYGHGGALGVGLIGIVQEVPAALLAPFLGALTDRRRPGRMLALGLVVMGLSMTGVAACVWLDAPAGVVFLLAPVVNLAVSVPRPAQSSLLPAVVRSPEELTAANVVSGWAASGSALLGPAAAGVLLGLGGGAALSIAVFGVVSLVGALVVLPVTGPRPLSSAQDSASLFSEVRDGVRAVSREPAVRALVGLLGSQYILVGALDVLFVVLAFEVLDLGPSGPGFLNAAFGAGGILGAFLAAFLVARRRLAPALIAGIMAAALMLGLVGVVPSLAGVIVLLAVIGTGLSIFDVTGRILLQRSASPRSLAGVFSLLESLLNMGLAVGSLFVPLVLQLTGPAGTVAALALLIVLVVASNLRRLRRLDESADVPQVQIQLLQSISIFSRLLAPALEGVARALEPVTVEAGQVVMREGDTGDRYYAIADGELAVSKRGIEVARLGRGEGFGEIALVRDVPRTATVVAQRRSLLYSLEKDRFVLAVTGHAPVERAVEETIARRMDELAACGEATVAACGEAVAETRVAPSAED